jgi:hypothetical protein
MISNYPIGLQNLIKDGWCRSHPALDITLGNGVKVYYSTHSFVFDGKAYSSRLLRVGTVRTSLSRSVDGCEIILNNADGETGLFLVDAEEALDGATATLSRIYINLNNDNEKYAVERLSGVIQAGVSPIDRQVVLALISDAYAGGGVVDAEVRRTCVWRYKDPTTCTYSGTNPDCDLSFEGANGCVAHFGMEMAKARFGGGGYFLDEDTRTRVSTNLPNGGNPIPNRNRYPFDWQDGEIPYPHTVLAPHLT